MTKQKISKKNKMKSKDTFETIESVILLLILLLIVLVGIFVYLLFTDDSNREKEVREAHKDYLKSLCSNLEMSLGETNYRYNNFCYRTENNRTVRFKILNINESYSVDVNPIIEVNK